MFISVVVLRGLLSELQNRGIDPDDFLRGSKLSMARIMDLRQYVTLAEMEPLVSRAVALTADPGLGLAVGANAPKTMLQLLGQLLLAEETMREAFASWQRYSVLLTDALEFRLLENGALASFICEPVVEAPCASFYVDLTLALALRIGSHFARSHSDLREVHFCHAAPSYARRYQAVFGSAVRFKQRHNALLFPNELLDRRQLHADQAVRSLLNEAVNRLLLERNDKQSLSQRVRSLLESQGGLAMTTAEVMGRRLDVSARTLRRRLAAEGTTTAKLVREVRCRLACQTLSRSDHNIQQLSELLGFSEPSAFHRAFKRWTGRTPVEFARAAAPRRRIPRLRA